MRKNASFAVAAAMLVLAAAFWAQSSVVSTARSNLVYSTPAASFLPVRNLEPAW
jgi:hypothetical protein